MNADPLLVLVVLGAGTYVLKAAGPLALGGGRSLPDWLGRLALLLPAPLLAALVVVSSSTDGQDLVIDARLAGLAVAGVALWKRAPFVVVVLVAAAATALVRLI